MAELSTPVMEASGASKTSVARYGALARLASSAARGAFAVAVVAAIIAPSSAPAQEGPDADARVRIVHFLQLGRSHAPNARVELERGISDPVEAVRIAAIAGLVALADPTAIPAIEHRIPVETSPSVKARLGSAVGQIRKSSFDSAKFVVQIGTMTNSTTVQNAQLPGVMRSAATAHASHLRGALVVEGPSDALYQKAAEKHLPVLMLDGQLARFSRAEASGNVTLAAQVEFVVRRIPSQVLRGTFHGGAAGSDSPKALESHKRLAELQGEVVSGAVESALRGVESSLVEASR